MVNAGGDGGDAGSGWWKDCDIADGTSLSALVPSSAIEAVLSVDAPGCGWLDLVSMKEPTEAEEGGFAPMNDVIESTLQVSPPSTIPTRTLAQNSATWIFK